MKPVLLVVHQRVSQAGRIGQLLFARGVPVEMRCPNLGCPLPEDVARYAGIVMFGGPMSANDDATEAGIRSELEWLPRVLDADIPFFGICLGAQLLARAAGASVWPHPEGKAEIGYYRIEPTEEGRDFLPEPMTVYQWHREGFDLPAGATLLATGEIFENQAFRIGRAYGVQYHPDVTRQMMETWTVAGAPRLSLPGAQPRALHLAQQPVHDAPMEHWTEDFLGRWLGLGSDDGLTAAAD